MKKGQWLLGALVFAAEIALWVGIGRLAFLIFAGQDSTLASLVGIAAAFVVVLIWSLFIAPRAKRRLARTPRILLISIVTIAVGAALVWRGDVVFGLALALGSTAIQIAGQFLLPDQSKI